MEPFGRISIAMNYSDQHIGMETHGSRGTKDADLPGIQLIGLRDRSIQWVVLIVTMTAPICTLHKATNGIECIFCFERTECISL